MFCMSDWCICAERVTRCPISQLSEMFLSLLNHCNTVDQLRRYAHTFVAQCKHDCCCSLLLQTFTHIYNATGTPQHEAELPQLLENRFSNETFLFSAGSSLVFAHFSSMMLGLFSPYVKDMFSKLKVGIKMSHVGLQF
jgi:hypothetical protein